MKIEEFKAVMATMNAKVYVERSERAYYAYVSKGDYVNMFDYFSGVKGRTKKSALKKLKEKILYGHN